MASDAFMEVYTRDVIGETFDLTMGMEGKRREGAFEISSFSIKADSNRKKDDEKAAQQPGQTGPTARPTPTGRQPVSPTPAQKHAMIDGYTIRKSVDSASPNLFLLCLKQEMIPWTIISFREAGDESGIAWLILEFTECYIDDFDWSIDPNASGESVLGQETLSISFKTVKMKYTPQTQAGSHGEMQIKEWNFNTHNSEGVPDLKSESWS